MTNTGNIISVELAIATATFAYYYYQSQRNVVQIKLPSEKIWQAISNDIPKRMRTTRSPLNS
jgi:hypothetical protein